MLLETVHQTELNNPRRPQERASGDSWVTRPYASKRSKVTATDIVAGNEVACAEIVL
jgi:hypothetical protein